MASKLNVKKNRVHKSNSVIVVKVDYVQVPDAEERLEKAFKILLSSFENSEKDEAKEALTN